MCDKSHLTSKEKLDILIFINVHVRNKMDDILEIRPVFVSVTTELLVVHCSILERHRKMSGNKARNVRNNLHSVDVICCLTTLGVLDVCLL